jgi:flagellar protein FlaF
MGLSISVSAAIIFIATVIVFGNLLGAYDHFEQAVVDAQKDSYEREDGVLRDRIAITAVDVENRTISLTNEGSETIQVTSLDLFLNGTLSNDAIITFAVEGSPSTRLWFPGETLVMTVDGELNHTLIGVVDGNGVAAYH